MPPLLFSITGNKITSLLLADNALQFSSQQFHSAEQFETAWRRKLSLATKVEAKYAAIRSVHKDDDSADVFIKYKTALGLPTNCAFSFQRPEDYDTFFTFLQQQRYFTRQVEQLTPFKAIINYLIGIAATIAFTWFCHSEALAIAAGTVAEARTSKARLFNELVGFLGPRGVLAAGGLLLCYLLYKAWMRFSNPPQRQRFLPPSV